MKAGLTAAFGWSVLQNLLRLLLSFLSVKVTAVLLGPSGIALVGQAGNFISLLKDALGNAIGTAVVKMTAEQGNEGRERMPLLWGTAVRLAAMLGIVVGMVVAAASRPLASWLFGHGDLWPVVALSGLVLPFALVGGTLSSILYGLKQFHLTTITDIGAAVIGTSLFVGLAYLFGLKGGLIGVTLAAGVGLIAVLIVFSSSRTIQLSRICRHWQRGLLPAIFLFYPMLLVHSASENFAILLKREMLILSLGVSDAGLWQATLRLSDMYTQVLFTALSLYLMPTLAEIKESGEFRRKMFRVAFYAAVITAVVTLAIFLCRDLIVHVVFTRTFFPVRDLLGYQLLGDIFRVAGWPLRSALMVQLRVKTYMGVEGGIGLGQLALTYGLLPVFGLQAATVAHAVDWGIALVVLLLLHSQAKRPRSEALEVDVPGNERMS